MTHKEKIFNKKEAVCSKITNYIYTRKPQVNDYVFNEYGLYILTSVDGDKCRLMKLTSGYYCGSMYGVCEYTSSIFNSSLVIDEKLVKFILKHDKKGNIIEKLGENMKNMASDYNDAFPTYDGATFSFYLLYMFYCTVCGRIINHVIKATILSFGFKTIKRYGFGVREIMINNYGWVYRVHRRKSKNKKKTIVYEIIKRIK